MWAIIAKFLSIKGLFRLIHTSSKNSDFLAVYINVLFCEIKTNYIGVVSNNEPIPLETTERKTTKKRRYPNGQLISNLPKRRRLSDSTCENRQKQRNVFDTATLKSRLSERLVWKLKDVKVPKNIFARAAKRDVESINLTDCDLRGVIVPDPFPNTIKYLNN